MAKSVVQVEKGRYYSVGALLPFLHVIGATDPTAPPPPPVSYVYVVANSWKGPWINPKHINANC